MRCCGTTTWGRPPTVQRSAGSLSERLSEITERNPDKREHVAYLPRGQRPSTTAHLGQLKLFLSTMQFLLAHAPRNRTVHVVYPGSAPGNSIGFLSELFPQCRWYLYDPRPFAPDLHTNKRVVEMKNTLFTDAIAEELRDRLSKKYVLLVSDIRVEPVEDLVHRDNQLQENWVRILRPTYAQLKFRLPRLPELEEYTYLKGEIFLQIFGAHASTETRLVLRGDGPIETTTYNLAEYEGALYYFNRSLRPSYYPCRHRTDCTDHCHDCVAMFALLCRYLERYATTSPLAANTSVRAFTKMVFDRVQKIHIRICKHRREILRSLGRRPRPNKRRPQRWKRHERRGS